MAFIKGQANQVIGVQMVSATDGSAFVGTTTLYVTGDGGTQTLSGTCVSEGNGYHSRVLTAAATDFTQVAYTFIGTGAVPQTLQLFPQTVPTLTPTQGTAAASAVSAYDLITDAFAELNVFLPGESVPNGDAQFGLRSLNGLLGSWAQQHLTIPSTARLLFDLVADQGGPTTPYSIGSGGDFDTPRPANPAALRGAALAMVTTPAFELPIDVLSPAEWQGLLNKTLSGSLPTMLFYDPTFTAGLGAIYLWPQPTDTTNQLVLYLDTALSTFADLTTAYQLPPGYRDALAFSLAARLATPYGRSVSQELTMKADKAVSLIKRGNVTLENAVNWMDSFAQYDIYSDQTWRR